MNLSTTVNGQTSPVTSLLLQGNTATFSGTITANGNAGANALTLQSTVANGYVGMALTNGAAGGRTYLVTSTDNTAGVGGGRFGVFDNNAGSYRLLIDSSGNATLSGSVTTTGLVWSYGSAAGLQFQDRSNSSIAWVWYSTGGRAALYNGGDHIWFQVNGMFPAVDNARYCGSGGNAWVSVASYGYVNSSDITHKTDLADLPDCLPFVEALKPQRYRFTNGPDDDRDVTHWGFVAQDVEAAIGGGKDFGGHIVQNGEQMIAYHELTAILWKALQEVTARLKAVEGKL